MSKFKTILAISIVAVIISVCAIAASAALSCTTEVYWNVRETEAWAQTVGYGPSSAHFFVSASIESMSTHDFSIVYVNSNYNTSATATTDHVTIEYPSPIPLVGYGGSIDYGYWG